MYACIYVVYTNMYVILFIFAIMTYYTMLYGIIPYYYILSYTMLCHTMIHYIIHYLIFQPVQDKDGSPSSRRLLRRRGGERRPGEPIVTMKQ